jgi:hypothetical protein
MKITTLVFILGFASNCAFAAPRGDCAGTPADAVVELPAPLNAWGQIVCTTYGHIISNKEGWLWSYPGAYSPVFVPSQVVPDSPAELGNKSYFTSISMTKVEGNEFQAAYSAFHSQFDENEALPVGYRLDVASVSGNTLKLYFFDYGDFAWGIWCPDKCEANLSFMVLNTAMRSDKARP